MSRVEADPSAPSGYRTVEDPAPAPTGPTAEDFASMSYRERVDLHAKDAELYRSLADADFRAQTAAVRRASRG